MEINVGKKIGEYLVEQYLGTGGFGSVYKVSKEDTSGKYVYALKHITFPSPEMYNEISSSMNRNQSDIDAYFKGMLLDIVAEFNTMRELSATNSKQFVTYYDHEIFGDSKRYDVLIRMELLTPVNNYCKQTALKVSDVIKIGIDIGKALKVCHQKRIIHRDIKEANIFVNNNGDFKLGDFGVSKTLDRTTQLMSRKGTPFYMAPEILLNQPYDFNADIYALGLVLYKLLNKSRYPFMPPYPQAFTNQDIERAQAFKLSGQKPLMPCQAQNTLGSILVKTLSSKNERYQTAEEFVTDLIRVTASFNHETLNAIVSEPTLNDQITIQTNAFTKNVNSKGTTIGLKSLSNNTAYGHENQDVFNLLDKSKTIRTNTSNITTNTLNTKTNKSVHNTIKKDDQFQQQRNLKTKIKSLNIVNFIIPVIFTALFIFYIDVSVRDVLFGNSMFFNNNIFRISVLIISGGVTVFFIIKILIFPDKKTLMLSNESKKWKNEILTYLEKIDIFVDKKAAHDIQSRHYKNLKGELSELKRRVRECKSFWKMTYSARQCEIEMFDRLVNLNNLITQKDYIITAGKSNDFKTLPDEKKSEFSLAVNNIKRLLEQREAQLQ